MNKDSFGGQARITVWSFFRFARQLGWRWFLRGIDYSRCYEYPAVYNSLMLFRGCRLLDIGSASYSLFPLYLVAQQRYVVYITDKDRCVLKHRRNLEGLGLDGSQENHDVFVEIQDARRLTYPDNYFDRICSVSTIEHIPESGDRQAMSEIGRTLKRGGIAVITVPCAPQFHEEWWDQGLVTPIGVNASLWDLFRRRRIGRRVFFQRRYDEEALRERLVVPSGLVLSDLWYFGERPITFSHLWRRRHPLLKLLSNWLNPLLSACFLHTMRGAITRETEGAILVLRKEG